MAKYNRINAIKAELQNLQKAQAGTEDTNALLVAATDMEDASAENYNNRLKWVKDTLSSNGIDLTSEIYSNLNDLLTRELEISTQPTTSADYVDKIQDNLRAISQLEDLTSDEADALIEETAKLFLQKQQFIDGIADKDSFEALQTTFNELNSNPFDSSHKQIYPAPVEVAFAFTHPPLSAV